MNSAAFEDVIFIINMRIRLIRDTLRLNPPPELFLEKCLDDLAFIGWVLAFLSQSLVENGGQFARNNEYAYASDTEWQFSQLLTEFSLGSGLFSPGNDAGTREKITALREASDERRRALEEADLSPGTAKAEPVVSSAELSSLLGGI